MSTHFRPRPPSASPTRPVTADSTIRTIPPSPPDSSDEAVKAQSAKQKPSGRLQTAKIPNESNLSDKLGGHTQARDFARFIRSAETGALDGLPTYDKLSNNQRKGTAFEKVPPINMPARSRSHSPHKRASVVVPHRHPDHHARVVHPNKHQHRVEVPKEGDPKLVSHDADNGYAFCPDTPTPIPHAQRVFAYTPLGVPASPQPGFKRAIEQSIPYLAVEQPYHAVSSQGTSAETETNFPPNHSPDSASIYRPQKLTLLTTHFDTPTSSPASPLISPNTPQPNLTGIPSPITNNRISGISQLSSPSARTTHTVQTTRTTQTAHTANTARSNNSVFSTPGRDELERKKPLVEPDEGPFAQVASMADLEAERKRVSEFRDGKEGWKDRVRRVGRVLGSCGGGEGRCAVM